MSCAVIWPSPTDSPSLLAPDCDGFLDRVKCAADHLDPVTVALYLTGVSDAYHCAKGLTRRDINWIECGSTALTVVGAGIVLRGAVQGTRAAKTGVRVLRDGEGATPQQLANSVGGPTAGVRAGQANGIKILAADIVYVSDLGSLGVIAGLLTGGIVASLVAD